MANLSLEIPDDEPGRARGRARREGVSLERAVREFLREYGNGGRSPSGTVRDAFRLANEFRYSSGGRRTWAREDLYRERLRRTR